MQKGIAIITSSSLRHKFYANSIADSFDARLVFSEAKPAIFDSVLASKISREHFFERDKAENRYFSRHKSFFDENKVINLSAGKINDMYVINKIKSVEPDIVAVFGSSILNYLFIEEFKYRLINLHLGLSPYYRGSGTSFWPLVNNEPEYVGATIHILASKVDAGNILAHARPEISEGDGPHDVGCKTIISGTEKLIDVLRDYLPGKTLGVQQWRASRERVYRRKDVTEQDISKMYQNFANGMIKDYLLHKSERDSALKLVDFIEKNV